ncbi:MAG TPA: hypothetical protein VFX52_14950 [Nocardioidaceae bacterium]|jgi:hypothetical protein|nr:hypothetical protein [Nocardioidaceae bacterium]
MNLAQDSDRVVRAADTLVPAQRTPPETVEVDHLKRHGTRCYWDVAECRWVCAG